MPHPTALGVGSVHYNYISSEYKFASSYVLRKSSRFAGVGVANTACALRLVLPDCRPCTVLLRGQQEM